MVRQRYSIRLMETFRSVFYTPIYVSISGDFWEGEGLDITFATCPARYPHPLSALNHGAADIVQSGIMRSIIAADWGGGDGAGPLCQDQLPGRFLRLGPPAFGGVPLGEYQKFHRHPGGLFTNALGILPVRIAPTPSGP